MTFDKSKVCVAGLHEVKEGTKGCFADSINALEEYVTQNSANGCLEKMKGQRDCLYIDELHTLWRFFYPAQEKTYRPYRTLEEAMVLKGKWIKHKAWDECFMVTRISFLNESLLCNGITADVLYNTFVMEDGTPVGVEV